MAGKYKLTKDGLKVELLGELRNRDLSTNAIRIFDVLLHQMVPPGRIKRPPDFMAFSDGSLARASGCELWELQAGVQELNEHGFVGLMSYKQYNRLGKITTNATCYDLTPAIDFVINKQSHNAPFDEIR